MATTYFDNVVIADTLTVVGQTSTSETIGTLTVTGTATMATGVATGSITFGTLVQGLTAFATPSALAATAFNAFASTVSGATLMGFGTTGDVTLKNRAGTSVAYVGPNTTVFTLVGHLTLPATAVVNGGSVSTTFYQSNGTTVALGYLAAGAMSVGIAPVASIGFYISNTATAASGVGRSLYVGSTVVAVANSDSLYHTNLVPTFTPGAFTGLTAEGIRINAFSVAGFTTPGNPIGINVGVITGTGASVATALQLAPPTGATTNYLIAHTTAATFSVTAAGALTSADSITAGAALFFGWTGRALMASPADSMVLLRANASGTFSRLIFGSNDTSGTSLVKNGVNVIVAGGSATAVANLGIGDAAPGTGFVNGLYFGTTATTQPSTSVDLVHLGGADYAAGARTLSIWSEAGANAEVAVSTHSMKIVLNGANYRILMTNA